MKEEKIAIPCLFYLYIHSKMFEQTKGKETRTKDLQTYLSNWRIPKQLRFLILKELEILKLLEIKRYSAELKVPHFNIDEYYKYHETLGIIPKKTLKSK